MIKFIATDMDDTLLTSQRTVSPYTLKILDEVRARGIFFTFCTGRMFDSAKSYIKMLNLDAPVIAYNGAMVKHSVTGEVLYHMPLKNEDAAEVLKLGAEMGVYNHIYKDDVLYCRELAPETYIYSGQTGSLATPTHKPLWECLDVPTTKIILIMPKERVQQVLPQMKQRFAGRLEVTVSKPEYLEFLNIDVNKGKTMLYLAQTMGIKQEETLAFGDALNDVPMLKCAGTGVAVANATPPALAAADEICAGCDEDGVAHYIAKNVLHIE